MFKLDSRQFSEAQREKLAWKAHNYTDFKLPRLKAWNYELCRIHRNGWVETYFDKASGEDKTRTVFDRPNPKCRKCCIIPRAHQRVGILWMYLKKRGLLADVMGLGKTATAGGVIAMMIETGEMPEVGRVVITPRAPALHQWYDELLRMMPGLNVAIAEGSSSERNQLYLQPWDVLLIGPEMLRNDIDKLIRFPLAAYFTDDVDALRNSETETSYACDRLGGHADRYYIMTGTPVQKKLPELHAVLDGIGGLRAFGNKDTFEKRYVRSDTVSEYDEKTGRMATRKRITGYKNMNEVKAKIAPMILRRTTTDLTDFTMPEIQPNDVMLDLTRQQRARYEELRRGVVQLLREEGTTTKRVTAMSKIHYGAAICAGLTALGEEDGPGKSVKLDWVQNTLTTGALQDEKVVVFANLKATVRALQARLNTEGIGFETIWGEDKDPRNRRKAQDRFWDDPNCRVLIGTKSIEQSLNLQVSRHLINIDTILNPARMSQLAGRVRRQGSAYHTVYVHNLLCNDTQEEKYMPALEREAALSSFLWDEESELFDALSPLALLQMISR